MPVCNTVTGKSRSWIWRWWWRIRNYHWRLVSR